MTLLQDLLDKTKCVSVTGLGYVGLPLAKAFAKEFRVIAYDRDQDLINTLSSDEGSSLDIKYTSTSHDLKGADLHVIAVPTNIDQQQQPDLEPLVSASKAVGAVLKEGDYVVYESTVYPGCTEEVCVPILEEKSLLSAAMDVSDKSSQKTSAQQFYLGYSPERIVPGDSTHTLTSITKIMSASTKGALEELSEVYNYILDAEVYQAPSIKVAEAAKVVENTQRDINISLVNELAIIFDKLHIDTRAVLDAAGTKWNFHKYLPGLVGGHCISVDPFYLMYKARQVGHAPQVIAAGRNVNDNIPHFIAQKVIKTLISLDKSIRNSRVLIMGVTFKENVSDVRYSKVIDLIRELEDYNLKVDIKDPVADPVQLARHYDLQLVSDIDEEYDAIILAVAHDLFGSITKDDLFSMSKGEPVIFDIKGILDPIEYQQYWRL